MSQDNNSTKIAIWVALITGLFVLAAAILSSPHWFKIFFPKQYIESEKIDFKKTINPQLKADTNTAISIDTKALVDPKEKDGTENLVISRIELSPKNFNIPSYLYFEIKNEGTKTLKNVSITANLGQAFYTAFDFTRNLSPTVKTDTLDKGFLQLVCPKIKENESIGIYLHISQPRFDNILLHADNMAFDKAYSYIDYQNSANHIERTGFQNFLRICGGITIVIIGGYFLYVFLTFCNRLFKL